MKKNKISCVAAICLATSLTYGQQNGALLVNDINTNVIHHLPEKMFVHTDKSLYMAGEIMWFRLYTVDGILHKPLHLSTVAYIELLDAQGKAVQQAKISLKASEDNGSIQLPLSLPSGNYIVRGYTSWMQSAHPAEMFSQTIQIINPLKDPAPGNQDTKKLYADFFPEGGNLVEGIENTLGFKVTDKNGKGITATGYILDQNNDTAASFSTFKFGIGKLQFTPLAGRHYTAVVFAGNGNTISQPLPQAAANGFAIRLTETADEKIHFSIQTNINAYQNLTVIARSQTIARQYWVVNMQGGKGDIQVSKRDLQPGITQFTVYNENGVGVAERLYFIPPPAPGEVSITTDASQYSTRNQVSIAVHTPENMVQPSMSMAVYKIDSLQKDQHPDIKEYFWLTGFLKGNIESAAWYFSADPLAKTAADNLMLTHGWRRIIQPAVPADTSVLPEYGGHIVSCRVMNTATNLPEAGMKVYLTVPNNRFSFYTAETNQAGIARFVTRQLYGYQQLIIQLQGGKQNPYKIDLLNPFAETTASAIDAGMDMAASPLLEEYSIAMQVNNIYNHDSMMQYRPPLVFDTLSFFGKAEFTYDLDNYKRFTTMEEVLREYVLPITLIQRNGKMRVRVVNGQTIEVHEDNLLFLLDGIPLADPSKILQYDPLLVKKLEIIPRTYKYGKDTYEGVANFVTYKNNHEGYDPELFNTAFDYEGLQLQREFYSPQYETAAQQASRIPDYRTTLYWQPEINATKQTSHIRFYTGDIKGNYQVVLQGIDQNGNTISASTIFEVK